MARLSNSSMRCVASFPISEVEALKHALRAWARTFPVALCLDSNHMTAPFEEESSRPPKQLPYWQQPVWEFLTAVGVADALCAESGTAFGSLRHFYDYHRDWLFGFISYDLKNEIEQLYSRHPDGIALPDMYFFRPEIVVGIRKGNHGHHATNNDKPSLEGAPTYIAEIYTTGEPPDRLWETFQQIHFPTATLWRPVQLHPRMSRDEYVRIVAALKEHIAAGDVYEVNLCQEFYAEGVHIDPLLVFEQLNVRARAPFSAFLRWYDRYLLCASPERFLAKRGQRLYSQPIKGTRRRLADPKADAQERAGLQHSEKDRAENAMIVDLVRNDLARHCVPGSVTVEELFGIYTFPTVHQLISTISGLLSPSVHPITALRDAFPMGSMTGAPKIRAMELIEQYERTRRGLYSGAVGYFSPEGDFDFNVVIRSILYRARTGYLSCQVGSAIVYDSHPEDEYEECLVKLEVMKHSLNTKKC